VLAADPAESPAIPTLTAANDKNANTRLHNFSIYRLPCFDV
jgi:hypothetical protein